MSKCQRFVGALGAIVGLLLSAPAAVHAHAIGPHKGQVVEWGEEDYHVEFVPDAKTGTVTVYVYGSHEDLDAAKVTAIDSKSLVLTLKTSPTTTIKLEPKPAKGDPAGKSSVFVGKHDVLTKDMNWEGTISGKVGTKPYSGDFKPKKK